MSDFPRAATPDELPGMLAVAKGVAEQTFPHTMDAKVWADEFVKLNPGADHGLMLGWFAAAIMAGYDTAQAKSPRSETRATSKPCGVTYPHPAHDECDGSASQPWPYPISEPERIYSKQDAEGLCAIAVAAYRKAAILKGVDRFLAWQLPDSVCSDTCVTERDYGKAQGWPKRSGTNLLNAQETRQMLEYVLAPLGGALEKPTGESAGGDGESAASSAPPVSTPVAASVRSAVAGKAPARIEPQYIAGSVSGAWVKQWQDYADCLERELAEAVKRGDDWQRAAGDARQQRDAQGLASLQSSAAFSSDYEGKIKRDAETIKALRDKLAELCDRLNWKGPSREANLAITVREARALIEGIDRIAGGVAFIMGPDSAQSATGGKP